MDIDTAPAEPKLDHRDYHRQDQQDVDTPVQASVNDGDEPKPPTDLSVRGIMSSMHLREQDREKIHFIQTLPLKEQVTELKELVYDRSEAALYFKNKSVKKEEEVEELRLEFDDRVRRVRHFWCNQIYKEHSRLEVPNAKPRSLGHCNI